MKLKKSVGVIISLLIIMTALTALTGCGGGKQSETTAPTTAPATTAEPTTAQPTTAEPAADPGDSVYTEPVVTAVDILTTYYSVGENNGWVNAIYTLGEGNDSRQYVSFIVIPTADGLDGSIAFADSEKEVTGFDDLSIMIRMNAEGFFDARNGDGFEKLAEVAYTANTEYFVELHADMNTKTYSVYVQAPETEHVLIAENYAFRTSANEADDLGKVFFVSAGKNDRFTVDYLKRQWLFDETKEYWSKGENFGWQQNGINLGRAYTGKVEVEFDMSFVGSNVGGSVGFVDSQKELYGFEDLAAMVRINYSYFDARNSTVFEYAGNCPAVADTVYHINLEADLDLKTYSYWVTPPGGSKIQIADNYAFRLGAIDTDDFGQVFVVSAHGSDQILMQNMKITQK